jgi:ethanolamine-phosphate phospho-lyase
MDLFSPYDLEIIETKRLDGYVSRNFKIVTANGNYLLKHHTEKERASILAENLLMEYLNDKLPISISSPVQKSLVDYADGSFSRLLAFIEGDFLSPTSITSQIAEDFGTKTAQLDNALCTYNDAQIQSQYHTWDLQNCLDVWPLAAKIENRTDRKIVDYFFDQYQSFAVDKLRTCRKQIIHGDLNDQNVLTSNNQISGVIDFGDMCHSHLINEVAIACAYLAWDQDNPLDQICAFIKGYHSKNPLEIKEVDLLYYLIPARLCVSICHAAGRIAEESADQYVLKDQERIWCLLKKWITLNPIEVKNRFYNAIGHKPVQLSTTRIKESRVKHLGSNLSLSYHEPIHMVSAAFQYMYDAQGNTYLDAYNNIPHVGHCHPGVSEAISRQTRLLNTNTRYLYDAMTNYAEKLLQYFPEPLNKIFFVNSGSAASDLAIRMARTFTNRNHLLTLEHGYHGNTNTAISISPYKYNGTGGAGEQSGITALPLPKLFQGRFNNGADYAEEARIIIDELLLAGKSPASFIAEPISGCGGQVPLAEDYLKTLKPFLEANNILSIIDEVQVGFGRLGDYFWGFEMHDIVPDIVVLGKPMGNGHPIGAVITTAEIADAFDNGMEFFSSFGGNPVSMEVATAVLEGEGLQQHAKEVGDYFRNRALNLQKKFPQIGDVRCQGLFLGLELINADGEPATYLADTVKNKMKNRLILTSTDGPDDNVIKLKPPLCFTKENVEQFFYHFDQVMTESSN